MSNSHPLYGVLLYYMQRFFFFFRAEIPNTAKTHEMCRKTVCFSCLKKCDRQVTEFMKERIKSLIKQDLDFTDARVPTGICNSCRADFQKRDSGKACGELPKQFGFKSIKIKRNTTDFSRFI